MLRSRVSISDIMAAINHTNIIDSPGLLSRNHQLFLALVSAQVRSPEDIGNIVVKSANGVPVRVQDIGSVAPAVEPVYTVVSANGKPAVLLSVNRQPDSNTVQVADEVHQEMASIRPTLPSGVDMRPFYDQSNIVTESIGSVRDAIIIGLFLSGLIIWLFLRDWGTAVMTGLVVPVTMVVTFIAMKMLGQSFNLMTLGGLAAAAGLVIDDTIVVVENIVLHRDGGEGPLPGDRERAQGTDRPADRIDPDADRRVPAAHHDHGSDRNVLQRAGDCHERVAADVARARAGVDQQSQHSSDSPRQAGIGARRRRAPRRRAPVGAWPGRRRASRANETHDGGRRSVAHREDSSAAFSSSTSGRCAVP